MKKFFSLVLALVMALSLTTVAFGADYTVTTDVDAQNALNEITSGTVTLDGDFGYLDFRSPSSPIDGVTVVGTTGTTVEDIYIMVHEGTSVKNITFENITFDGATGGLRSNDIVLENVTIKNCKFINGATISFGNYPVKNLTVVDCVFDNAGSTATNTTAIYMNAGVEGNTVISGNTISNSMYNAIQFSGNVAGNVEISNNTITNTTDRAIRFNNVVAGATLTITGNTVTNGTDADGEVMKATSIADGVVVNAWNNDWDGGTVVNAELKDSNAALYDLYEGDDDLYVGGTIRTKVAAKKLTKTQAGQVAGWDINGVLYVEINKSEATNGDYYLTNHGKDKAILYLREAENHGVYTLTGKAYDNFNEGDDNCGEWNYDPELVAMYKDDVDGDIYTDQGTTAYMLVGKTVVGVELADEDKMVDHQMEGVYDAKDKLVGVKCAVCGATGKVYESVAKVPFGADYDFFDGLPYVLNKVAVKPADTETKVESAETFDAGIAMYVGMSVMAAAGSAVVIGKKKD